MAGNLAVVNQSQPSNLSNLVPKGIVINSLQDVMTIGKLLAASRYFKDAVNESQAVAKILRGWELGIPPVATLENIHVIDGKTTLSVHLIAAKIDESGYFRKRIIAHTNEICSIRFDQKSDGVWETIGISEFTIDDAKTAKLLGKNNWQQYPKAMLYSRALAQGARWYCSAVFMGQIYVPEELESNTDSFPSEASDKTQLQTNSERISELLDDLQIFDSAQRKAIVSQELKGRKALELDDKQLAELLSNIRASVKAGISHSSTDLTTTEIQQATQVDSPTVDVQAEAMPVEDASTVVETMPETSREAISNLLDALGVSDTKQRQKLAKNALDGRLPDALSPKELQAVLATIRNQVEQPAEF